MTLPTIAQNAPYVWAVLGASNVGIPTIAQDAPYVWTLPADANGNYAGQQVFNITSYGAIAGDNNTNKVVNTTAITNAIADAATLGGIVFFPPGTWRSKNVNLTTNNVAFVGCGPGISIWKLADSENTDLLSAYASSINLAGTSGAGSNTALQNLTLNNITLDGNKAGQVSGPSYPLRMYAYGDILDNVEIKNGYTGGVLRDYFGTSPYNTSPRREPMWRFVTAHDNNNVGIEVGGPTDAVMTCCDFNDSGSHNLHLAPNGGALQLTNLHTWSAGLTDLTAASALMEAAFQAVNCEFEGSDTMQLVMLANSCSIFGGKIFRGSHNGSGLQIGQINTKVLATAAVASPFTLTTQPNANVPSAFLQFVITGAGASGSLAIVGTAAGGGAQSENLACSGNGTFVSVNAYATVTSVTVTGLAGFSITVNGLTAPYTNSVRQSAGLATLFQTKWYNVSTSFVDITNANGAIVFNDDAGGYINSEFVSTTGTDTIYSGSLLSLTQFISHTMGYTSDGTNQKGGWFRIPSSTHNGFTIYSTSGSKTAFNVDASSFHLGLPNATDVIMYSDEFSTQTLRLKAGTVCYFPSTSAAATATSGTITTASVGIARVSPTGAVTAVVLQAGTNSGQRVTVINEAVAANTITFAASGTSNVATGTGEVIAGLTAAAFVWDSSTSLWYRV